MFQGFLVGFGFMYAIDKVCDFIFAFLVDRSRIIISSSE